MTDGLHDILAVFSFAIGACVASFLNVVIWRVPRGESIVSPPSHCPKCDAAIRWWQNIPILSWIALRGRCAKCRAPISPRYILIETLGGCLFLAAFWRFGFSVYTLVMWIWIALMIVGSFIDFDHKLLPDFVTVGGMVLGAVNAGFLSYFAYLERGHFLCRPCLAPIAMFVFGLVFGFGLLWIVRFLGSLAFRREAMGLGDVFLMGAVGALFGLGAVLVTLILSSLFGSVVGLSMIALAKTRFGKHAEIPYGPYICLGCLAWMFYGEEIMRFYLTTFIQG